MRKLILVSAAALTLASLSGCGGDTQQQDNYSDENLVAERPDDSDLVLQIDENDIDVVPVESSHCDDSGCQ